MCLRWQIYVHHHMLRHILRDFNSGPSYPTYKLPFMRSVAHIVEVTKDIENVHAHVDVHRAGRLLEEAANVQIAELKNSTKGI